MAATSSPSPSPLTRTPRPRNVSSGWTDAPPLSFTAIHNTRGLRRPRSRLINGPGWNFNDNSVYDFSWGRQWRKRLLVFASPRSTQRSTLDSVFGEEILSTRHGSCSFSVKLIFQLRMYQRMRVTLEIRNEGLIFPKFPMYCILLSWNLAMCTGRRGLIRVWNGRLRYAVLRWLDKWLLRRYDERFSWFGNLLVTMIKRCR